MTDSLNTKIRQQIGSNAVKEVRKAGLVPAVLYGHGEDNVNLSVSADELGAAIRRGAQMVNLEGGVSESALISDVQWDTFGIDMLHVDLTRVSATELVQVAVKLELRGEAPGTKEGGVIDHMTHEIRIECPAGSIPSSIEVSINSLGLEEALKVGELELPEGAKLLTSPDAVVVQCNPPVELDEEEEEASAIEPEVIGRKEEDEETEGGS